MGKMIKHIIVLFIIFVAEYHGCKANRNHTIDNRIVGGTLALLGQFPYQVSLRTDNGPMCGGTIISSTYVLTAAHCVVNNNVRTPANRLSVRAGSIRLDSGGEVIGIAEVKVHPQYRFPSHDVALLRLARVLRFSNTIRPLAPANQHVPPGTWVLVSGFGATQTGGRMSNELRYVFLRAQSDTDCYRRTARDPSVFCLTHPPGRGICQGDSGGPANAGGRLLGAMSFTLGGCGTTEPDGFARISYVYQWVMQNAR